MVAHTFNSIMAKAMAEEQRGREAWGKGARGRCAGGAGGHGDRVNGRTIFVSLRSVSLDNTVKLCL